MSISYGELATIGTMTNNELVERCKILESNPRSKDLEDEQDELSAILTEMELRRIERP